MGSLPSLPVTALPPSHESIASVLLVTPPNTSGFPECCFSETLLSPLSAKTQEGTSPGPPVPVPSTLDHPDVCAQGLASGALSTARPSEARAGRTCRSHSVSQPQCVPCSLGECAPCATLGHTWSSGPWRGLSAPRSKDPRKQMGACEGHLGNLSLGKLLSS